MASYTKVLDREFQSRLEQRYRAEIAALKLLGFSHLAYCEEDHGAFSAIRHSMAALLALSRNEVLKVRWPFRLTLANVLMEAENPPSIALCMGMGVKIYTPLHDGTIIISSNFISGYTPRPGSKVIRIHHQASLAETWQIHQKKALAHSGQSAFLEKKMTFNDYVMISTLEEQATQII